MAASYLRYFFLHKLFDFCNFLNFTFKHQNTGYFKASLGQIRGISPVSRYATSYTVSSSQKQWTRPGYLPRQMTYNRSIFHNGYRVSVSFISCIPSTWKFLSNNCIPNAHVNVIAMHATISFTPDVRFHSFSVGWARDQSLDEAQHFINPIRFLDVPVQSMY